MVRKKKQASSGQPKRRAPGRPPSHMGKLAVWIESVGRTREDVAEELGVSRRYLDHLCREYRRPALDLAVKIERLTKGQVSVEYLANLKPHSKD